MEENKFKKIEEKWQKFWEENPEISRADDNSKKPKKYVLVEFPYPSGSGLHIGHTFSFTGGDVYARYQRMKGFEVLFPMGWDAFGLPTENYAIKMKRKPQEVTKENTDMFRSQMKRLAFSFDWQREIDTTNPKYYKWTQWIFIQLFKKGLAYKKEMPINWCPSCLIGLANEEVINGKCERCGAEVSRRNISQWVVKITDYADKLIEGLEETKFIEKVKQAQINWVGKSEGVKIKFKVKDRDDELEVFTTRPDTLYGVTFMVVSPGHKLIESLDLPEIKAYVKQAGGKSDMERTELNKEKTGVFSGLYAINPVNNKEIPIWISDFVLASYGTGAIMAVPAHDERDNAFAKQFGLEITRVIMPQRVYVDGKAKGYYEKRQKKNKEFLILLNRLAGDNNKSFLVNGGWAATIQVGCEYRECEDLDFSILRSEKNWWDGQLKKLDFTVGPIFGQDNPDEHYQAVRKPDGEVDTHIDIDVIEKSEEYEPVVFEGETYRTMRKNLIIQKKMDGWESSKEKRWKEDADFMVLENRAYTEVNSGILINSPNWNGIKSSEAIKEAVKWLEENKLGERACSYHLRDWIFSRQHYWGEPIPMINCPKDGWVPVPEQELPVVLPEVEAYEPTDDGQSPLSKIDSFVNCKCPVCGGEAKRETDTMPNWAGSDWYFLRYLDPHNSKMLVSSELINKWMPVDVYIGGDEHNTLHLLYSRFIYKFLVDIGVIPKNIPEPYVMRMSHGVILGSDNQRMSKSKGNVIVPEIVADKYGVDVVRIYLMFIGPFVGTMVWNENTLMGVKRFLDKIERYTAEQIKNKFVSQSDNGFLINQLVKEVGEDIETFGFNTVIAKLMKALGDLKSVTKEEMKIIIKLLAPLAPYMAEELWSWVKTSDDPVSVHMASWPKVDGAQLISQVVKIPVAINGKMRILIEVLRGDIDNKEKMLSQAYSDEKIGRYLKGRKVIKEVIVPGKMVNLVVK